MRKLIILGLTAALAVVSCENEDVDVIFDGKTAISFETTAYNVVVPEEDVVLTIPVNVTTASNQDRTFNASVVDASNSSEFSLGNIVIPAGEYEGNLTVNFDFSAITGADGDVKEAVISLVSPEGGNTYNETVTISYFREIVCNDATVELTFDDYPDESAFAILDNSGNVLLVRTALSLDENSPTSYDVTLPDGNYTLEVYDAYGDGGLGVDITCSILTFVSGAGGAFPGSTPTAAQYARLDPLGYGAAYTAQGGNGGDVEVTNFTVAND